MKIPARIVTGYKAKKHNMIENYLLVKAKDAHSWVEAYVDSKGWIRIDPTKYAVVTNNSTLDENNQFWQKITLKVMYIKYKIEEWVLYYSRLKQIKLINSIKDNLILLLYIFGGFILLSFSSLYLANVGLKYSRVEKVSKIYSKFLKKLGEIGYYKKSFEGAESFAHRVGNDEVVEITNLYLKLKYRFQDKDLLKEFEKRVDKFRLDTENY